MSGPKEDDAERDSFKRAFGDVKPLRTSSPKRAPRDIAPRVRRAPTSVGRPVEALVVEREANGIITGRRASTHASIVDALEDPRLEVDA